MVNLFFESMYLLYHFLLPMHFSLFLTIITNEKISCIFFALKSFHLVWWVFFFYFPFLKQKMHAGTQNKYNKPIWPYLLFFFVTYSISCSMIYYLWYLVVTCFFFLFSLFPICIMHFSESVLFLCLVYWSNYGICRIADSNWYRSNWHAKQYLLCCCGVSCWRYTEIIPNKEQEEEISFQGCHPAGAWFSKRVIYFNWV